MTDAMIKRLTDIAGELDTGMACFLHRQTGELISFPDPDKFADIGPDDWQAERALVDTHPDEYIRIQPMSSRESFGLMEKFAEQLSDESFRDKLRNTLSQSKPFQRFRMLIHESDYRQDWFIFRDAKTVEWLWNQLRDRWLPGFMI